jgi:hypothetical protein
MKISKRTREFDLPIGVEQRSGHLVTFTQGGVAEDNRARPLIDPGSPAHVANCPIRT